MAGLCIHTHNQYTSYTQEKTISTVQIPKPTLLITEARSLRDILVRVLFFSASHMMSVSLSPEELTHTQKKSIIKTY